ncbi:ADP-ribosylglycohydrolase family protein [bacterium]|nr:ADP-ribosylglycohydrolase family protein [bacterium]
MDREKLRDRIAGSFYGLLTGDALGCPVEGFSSPKIRRNFGRVTEMEERDRPKGLHSDDGQQAIMVCDSVLAFPKNPGKVFAKLIVDMYKTRPWGGFPMGLHRGTGGNFRRTVKSLAGGADWNQAASVTAGNGAAMRIAPLGLFFREDRDGLAQAVVNLSRVTHGDIRGISAASAVAYVTAKGVNWRNEASSLADEEITGFLEKVEDLSSHKLNREENKHDFSEAIKELLLSLKAPQNEVLKNIEKAANRSSFFPGGPTSGYALASVVTSLYMFFTSQDFENTLIDTVMLGGDTDTTGAMVGGMCGAVYGLTSIPQRWLKELAAYPFLEDRIDALLEKKHPYFPQKTAVELERGWTEKYYG